MSGPRALAENYPLPPIPLVPGGKRGLACSPPPPTHVGFLQCLVPASLVFALMSTSGA